MFRFPAPTDQEGARQVALLLAPSFVTVAIVRASDPSPALSDLSEKRKKEGREDGDDDDEGHDHDRRDSACLTQGSVVVVWKTHVSWNQEDGLPTHTKCLFPGLPVCASMK